jgi:hypothetical protein
VVEGSGGDGHLSLVLEDRERRKLVEVGGGGGGGGGWPTIELRRRRCAGQARVGGDGWEGKEERRP